MPPPPELTKKLKHEVKKANNPHDHNRGLVHKNRESDYKETKKKLPDNALSAAALPLG